MFGLIIEENKKKKRNVHLLVRLVKYTCRVVSSLLVRKKSN